MELTNLQIEILELDEMEAVFGESSCINSWMQLVRKVSWNFPGLETEACIDEHEQTVLKFMNKKQALCVKSQGTIIGVLLFSRNKNMICCLAVDPEHRREGIASILLRKALNELDARRESRCQRFVKMMKKGLQQGHCTENLDFRKAN